MLPFNSDLKVFSRELRNHMTQAERLLWYRLKNDQLQGLRFYRQKIIGNYIVDFYCHQAKVVIELDGGQHYLEDKQPKDEIRDKFLNDQGLRVLRFSNMDILKNLDGVIQAIATGVIVINPPTPPSPKGE